MYGDWTYPPVPHCPFHTHVKGDVWVGGGQYFFMNLPLMYIALLEGMCQADNPLNVNVNHCNVDEYKLDVYK